MEYEATPAGRDALQEILRVMGVAAWQGRLRRRDVWFLLNQLTTYRDSLASECEKLRPDSRPANFDTSQMVDHFMRIMIGTGRVSQNVAPPHRAAAAA